MIENLLEVSSFKAQKVEYQDDQQYSSILLQIKKLTLDKVSDHVYAMFA